MRVGRLFFCLFFDIFTNFVTNPKACNAKGNGTNKYRYYIHIWPSFLAYADLEGRTKIAYPPRIGRPTVHRRGDTHSQYSRI